MDTIATKAQAVPTIDNNVYVVRARNTKFSIPRSCTNCLESTKYIEKLSTSRGLGKFINKKKVAHYKLPLCAKCLKIRKKHRTQLIMTCISSTLISCAAFIIMASMIEGLLPLWITMAIFTLLFMGLMCFRKTDDIGNACTRLKSAKVKWASKKEVEFTFATKEYANMFYEANSEYAQPPFAKKGKNTHESSSYFAATPYPAIVFILCFIITTVLSIYSMPIVNSFENFGKTAGLSPTETAVKNENINDFRVETTPDDDATVANEEDENTASSAEEEQNLPQPFSIDAAIGSEVYADITSIVPFTSLSDSSTGNSWAICKCTTAEGKIVYIGISSTDYMNLIDNTANLNNPQNATFKTVTYSPAKRFNGTMANAENVCQGLSQAIGTPVLIDFVSIG